MMTLYEIVESMRYCDEKLIRKNLTLFSSDGDDYIMSYAGIDCEGIGAKFLWEYYTYVDFLVSGKKVIFYVGWDSVDGGKFEKILSFLLYDNANPTEGIQKAIDFIDGKIPYNYKHRGYIKTEFCLTNILRTITTKNKENIIHSINNFQNDYHNVVLLKDNILHTQYREKPVDISGVDSFERNLIDVLIDYKVPIEERINKAKLMLENQ